MSGNQDQTKIPIVYSDKYNITFGSLEKLHVFDSCKWGKVLNILIEKSSKAKAECQDSENLINITKNNITEAVEARDEELRIGHSSEYLNSLKKSLNVAKIVEVGLVAMIPNRFVQSRLLSKFRYQVGGTIQAAKLALKRSWAINIGGGFHHASEDAGGGFCVYADISIAIKSIQQENPDYKFMIIDLDAHQGNGHERDFTNDKNVFILDIYNEGIYPHDEEAKRGIDISVGLMSYTKDKEYLEKLNENLDKAFDQFEPQLIVYNAGTDCLLGDPLGRLSISEKGIVDRDEIVFKKAKERKCPIVMLTSGGYQHTNAAIIANSIWNLFQQKIIQC